MIVADTNVWARAFLNDDQVQALKARNALADARSKGGVFVPLIVMAELAWVLRSRWDGAHFGDSRKPAANPRSGGRESFAGAGGTESMPLRLWWLRRSAHSPDRL